MISRLLTLALSIGYLSVSSQASDPDDGSRMPTKLYFQPSYDEKRFPEIKVEGKKNLPPRETENKKDTRPKIVIPSPLKDSERERSIYDGPVGCCKPGSRIMNMTYTEFLFKQIFFNNAFKLLRFAK